MTCRQGTTGINLTLNPSHREKAATGRVGPLQSVVHSLSPKTSCGMPVLVMAFQPPTRRDGSPARLEVPGSLFESQNANQARGSAWRMTSPPCPLPNATQCDSSVSALGGSLQRNCRTDSMQTRSSEHHGSKRSCVCTRTLLIRQGL